MLSLRFWRIGSYQIAFNQRGPATLPLFAGAARGCVREHTAIVRSTFSVRGRASAQTHGRVLLVRCHIVYLFGLLLFACAVVSRRSEQLNHDRRWRHQLGPSLGVHIYAAAAPRQLVQECCLRPPHH